MKNTMILANGKIANATLFVETIRRQLPMTGRGFITLIQIDVQQHLTIKAFLTYLS